MKTQSHFFVLSIISMILMCVAFLAFKLYQNKFVLQNESVVETQVTPPEKQSDPKNISYRIGDELFTLTNGAVSYRITPDSETSVSVRLFQDPVFGDLDQDGDIDAVVLLTYNAGGSGTFYYTALALNTNNEFKSTNALLLGDRIAPQTIELHDGRAVVNYAVRRDDEPFSTSPSIGKSLFIHLNQGTGEIGELVKDFEGEANPEAMTLFMHSWTWIQTVYADTTKYLPKKEGVFGITFKESNLSFSVTTDCNGIGGNFTQENETLTLENMISTMMYCEGSDETIFSQMLSNVSTYSFTSKGELILTTKDGTHIYFR